LFWVASCGGDGLVLQEKRNDTTLTIGIKRKYENGLHQMLSSYSIASLMIIIHTEAGESEDRKREDPIEHFQCQKNC
jgi:hypothetical protein